MATPPPLFPRTIFLTRPDQASKPTRESPSGPHCQETVNAKASHFGRSQSLSTTKPLPPLPRWTSHSEPLYESPDLLENTQNVQDAPQKPETDQVSRIRSLNLKKRKPLPPLPAWTSNPERLYENPDLLTNDCVEQEQDHKGSEAQSLSRQPPPLPPKPLKPPRIPFYGTNSGLESDSNAECPGTIPNLKLSRDSGEKLPRPPPLPPPLYPRLATSASHSPSVSDSKNIPIYLEILPDTTPGHQRTNKPLPLLPKARPHTDDENKNFAIYQDLQDSGYKSKETDELTEWWNTVEPWEDISLGDGSSAEEKLKVFRLKVHRIQMAMKFFTSCFNKSAETLRSYIAELNGVVENSDKISRKMKIQAITGGATGGIGSVAIVAGIVLAPITMGASLAVTAVGVGAVAAGGATGAAAAIANKKRSSSDKKKVEQIVHDYKAEVLDIDRSLEFVAAGVRELKKHDISKLKFEGHEDERSVLVVAELAKNNVSSIQTACRSSGILQGFVLDDCSSDEDSQKQKKDSMTKFGRNVHEFTQQLQEALDDLNRVQEIFSTVTSQV
uniref:Apolipoprotein L domain-containing protein 1-like n=3 Tax=Scleropages formosus TaxID=113540 RepID=A0A8C9WBR0_SCLFO